MILIHNFCLCVQHESCLEKTGGNERDKKREASNVQLNQQQGDVVQNPKPLEMRTSSKKHGTLSRKSSSRTEV